MSMMTSGPIHAMAAVYSGWTRFDVYLNVYDYDSTTLLHEALHSALGMNDNDLARRLGVYDGDYKNSSPNIQDALLEHGCGGPTYTPPMPLPQPR